MPKHGAEITRKAALINAAISTVGDAGSLDVTVAQIARRAGMSPALAHHYFGSKDQMLLAAMRHILTRYGQAVAGHWRAELGRAEQERAELGRAVASAPDQVAKKARARLSAIIAASFDPENFHPATMRAWVQFYAHAQVSPPAARLLRVYRRRLRSNLLVALRPLTGARAGDIAATAAALIDGLYLRAVLSDQGPDEVTPEAAARLVRRYFDDILG